MHSSINNRVVDGTPSGYSERIIDGAIIADKESFCDADHGTFIETALAPLRSPQDEKGQSPAVTRYRRITPSIGQEFVQGELYLYSFSSITPFVRWA